MTTLLVNLTPHALTLSLENGLIMTLPPSGKVARIATTPGKVEVWEFQTCEGGEVFRFPLAMPSTMGEVEGLPPCEKDTLYVVSAMVKSALALGTRARSDLVSPGTGPQDGAIRKDGQIVAVTRLVA